MSQCFYNLYTLTNHPTGMQKKFCTNHCDHTSDASSDTTEAACWLGVYRVYRTVLYTCITLIVFHSITKYMYVCICKYMFESASIPGGFVCVFVCMQKMCLYHCVYATLLKLQCCRVWLCFYKPQKKKVVEQWRNTLQNGPV